MYSCFIHFYISLLYIYNAMVKRILFVLINILMICSCRESLPEAGFELLQKNIECDREGGEFEIPVNGRPDWSTDNTADWISIRKYGESALVIIDKNPGSARHNKIGFKIDGCFYDYLEVTQESSDEFSVDKSDIRIGYKGGLTPINLICFNEWTVETNAEWISVEKYIGNEPEQIILDIAQNPYKEERQGTVSINSNGKTLTINIKQALSPVVEVETSEVSFDGDGGQTSVLYMSNTEVIITCENDWIRLIQTDQSVKKVSFEAKRNLGDSRKGVIRITSADDADIFKDIVIKQGPKIDHPALSFEEGTKLEISETGTIQLHPIFTDMTDHSLSWKSSDPQIASVEGSGAVHIHSGGTCVITAKNSYHSVDASIILDIRPKAIEMYVMFGMQNMNDNPIAVRFPGEKMTITVTMNPSDAYNEDITYFSSDESVAYIIGNVIHCLNPGRTDIYIESIYQSMRQMYTIFVIE